jgi:hypothetical protein
MQDQCILINNPKIGLVNIVLKCVDFSFPGPVFFYPSQELCPISALILPGICSYKDFSTLLFKWIEHSFIDAIIHICADYISPLVVWRLSLHHTIQCFVRHTACCILFYKASSINQTKDVEGCHFLRTICSTKMLKFLIKGIFAWKMINDQLLSTSCIFRIIRKHCYHLTSQRNL